MMTEIFDQLSSGVMQFLFYYPLFMAYLWMVGAIYYFKHWESGKSHEIDQPPVLSEYPPVSLVIPCYNESAHIRESIDFLRNHNYPSFDIIAVNDGSSDDTGRILDELAKDIENLRVIHLVTNQGKAVALRTAALMSPNEFLICIDGDAILDKNAATWIVSHFISGPRVGAVTGNPRIRTRSSLLGKIQVGEFSAIIGMIKRAQRIYGRVFTVSGVVAGFRKSALQSVGYWNIDTVTDDIDISWRLQLNHWDIRFEPNALCWILMPETIKGLLQQRIRWAQGGMEAFIRYGRSLFAWRKRRMWGVCLEYFTSIIWSYAMAITFVLLLLAYFIDVPGQFRSTSMFFGWHGVILGTTCLLQFFVSLTIDSKYEKGIGRYCYWMIWYPLAYWILNVITTVIAVPKAIFKRKGKRGVWTSPDRGLKE
jgi:biofilm PGA synthesis N-glycosyltransferase PgaC